MTERYLGDGVYVNSEHGMICLYTSDGVHVTNRIYLKPEVLEAFRMFLDGKAKVEDPNQEKLNLDAKR